MHLSFSANETPANDNGRVCLCAGCNDRPAGRDGLCRACDSELAAHLDAAGYFTPEAAEAYFAAGDAEGELLAAGVSVDDGARFAAVEVDDAAVCCTTCNDAREFHGEPSRHNPSGVHDCPDCG